MRLATLGALCALFFAPAALAQTAQQLPFSQNWSDTGLITVTDDWTGVPGIIGYRGDDLTAATGTDPQTIVADGSATPVNVNANKTSPGTEISGGNYEFEITDPTVAFQGSSTSDAPHIVIRVVTTGLQNIRVRYNLRDLDDAANVDAVQPVALQFRVGDTGDYTNVDAGFVADASAPGGATLVTPVDATLPASANDQATVDIRILTTNAVGSDEMIGIDDIQVTGDGMTAAEPEAYTASLTGSKERPTPNTSPATGFIDATLTGTELVVTGAFSGLTGDYTMSHIHIGGADVAGDVIFTLDPTVAGDSRGGTFEAAGNTFTLSPDQVTALESEGDLRQHPLGGVPRRRDPRPARRGPVDRLGARGRRRRCGDGHGHRLARQGRVHGVPGRLDGGPLRSARPAADFFDDVAERPRSRPGSGRSPSSARLSQFNAACYQINQSSTANDLTSLQHRGARHAAGGRRSSRWPRSRPTASSTRVSSMPRRERDHHAGPEPCSPSGRPPTRSPTRRPARTRSRFA